jgi:hypothetical protein
MYPIVNAVQGLFLNVPIQDLILKHFMLSTLGANAQKEWELHTAHQDIPLTTEFITFGNKMQGIGPAAECSDTKDNYYLSTIHTISCSRGQ